MRIAVMEDRLKGETVADRLHHAKQLGVEGVAFDFAAVQDRVEITARALAENDLQAAVVHAGGSHLLHPEMPEREAALVRLQTAMTTALDLGTAGVVFYAHLPDTPRLPDLFPYKTSIELEAELLVSQLRTTLADFALALDARLYLAPQTRQQSHLIQRLAMADTILTHLEHHPHLGLAADMACMLREEDDIPAAMQHVAGHLGAVYLNAHGDVKAVVDALKTGAFDGWLVLDSDDLDGAVDRLRTAIGA